MTQFKRPGPVTAVAVLFFLFGVGGLLMSLCGAGAAGALTYLAAHPPIAQPGQPDVGKLITNIDAAAPSLTNFLFVTTTGTFIFCLLEVIGGVGLLKMRYWGRRLAIFYAVGTILVAVGTTAYSLTVMQPQLKKVEKAVSDWMGQQNAKAKDGAGGGGGGGGMPPAMMGNSALNGALSMIGTAFDLLYPGIVLAIMLLPKTRRAFAIANGDATAEPEDVYGQGAGDPPAVKAAPPPVERPPPPDDEFRYVARDD